VDPRAGLDDGEEKILDYRDSNSDLSVVQLVASRYTDYAILAHRAFLFMNIFIREDFI
jgi:hypothetical protein